MQRDILQTSPGVTLLLDPDNWPAEHLETLLGHPELRRAIHAIVVGGSYVHSERFAQTITLAAGRGLPLGTFLGAGPIDSLLSPQADFVLLPVAIGASSSRFLADHVLMAAPLIRRYRLGICRIGYIQLQGGQPTSASFFTQVTPVPRDKPELVETLALTAAYLGVHAIYLEAGSGASLPVTRDELRAAIRGSALPVFVGGGIRSLKECRQLLSEGAHSVFVGSHVERTRSIEWLLHA